MPTVKERIKSWLIFLGLFAVTFATTTIAGAFWVTGLPGPYTIGQLSEGLTYSLSIIFILGVHEFGHYFAARHHKVDSTLPFFIPFPPIMGFFNFGTMGAVIKTKTVVPNNKAMFDIGVWGPLAGFAACIIVLVYGFINLPDVNYILAIHPDYFSPEYGKGAMHLEFGDTMMMFILRELFTGPGQFVPPMSEIYHYPYICAGWLGLFVTSMNMIPVGQLDGGHITYSMFGNKRHELLGISFLIILLILGGTGLILILFDSGINFGWPGWLLWGVALYFFVKVKHPPVTEFSPLNRGRKIAGWIALTILLLTFSPTPFTAW